MKFVSTFEITKGFDRWLHLVDVELKDMLVKVLWRRQEVQ